MKGLRYGRGTCRRCGTVRALTQDNRVRQHKCPGHPLGYTQQPEPADKILSVRHRIEAREAETHDPR